MLRIKVPQGVLDVRQLYALATVAEDYSRGFGFSGGLIEIHPAAVRRSTSVVWTPLTSGRNRFVSCPRRVSRDGREAT
jgi:hypothetical protein